MTIASQLEALTTNLAAAKGAVTTKGGTVGDTGLAGLASEIGTIPTGQSGPLDPAVVYANNRPSNWLQMPSDANVADNELYYLLDVDANRTNALKFGVKNITSTGKYDVDFGTVTNGAFVPDSSYYVHDISTNIKTTINAPMSIFQTVGTEKQIIMRVKPQSGNFTTVNNLYSGDKTILEFKGKATSCQYFYISSYSSNQAMGLSSRLRYFTLLGTNNIQSLYKVFTQCVGLEAILSLHTANVTSLEDAFSGCYNLIALPNISAPNATTCKNMFSDCRAIEYVPSISVASATTLNSMFKNCYALKETPQLTTTAATDLATMFNGCHGLKKVNSFDTSHATTMLGMFGSCYELVDVALLDTSSVTTMNNMFSGCSELQSCPQLNTTNVTNFYQMFNNCASLRYAPQLNTSSGTEFYQMFYGCSSLEEVPQYDISSATSVRQMFATCYGFEYVDLSNYDFSSISVSSNADSFISSSTLIGGGNVYLPGINNFPVAGIPASNAQGSSMFSMTAGTGDYTSFNQVNMIITEESNMIPLQGTAYKVFGSSTTNPTVYVPDSLYATYAADSNWSELGARLKKMSDLPA